MVGRFVWTYLLVWLSRLVSSDMEIVMEPDDITPMFCESLQYVLLSHPGSQPVFLVVSTPDTSEKVLRLSYEVDGCVDLEFAVDVLTGAI